MPFLNHTKFVDYKGIFRLNFRVFFFFLNKFERGSIKNLRRFQFLYWAFLWSNLLYIGISYVKLRANTPILIFLCPFVFKVISDLKLKYYINKMDFFYKMYANLRIGRAWRVQLVGRTDSPSKRSSIFWHILNTMPIFI